MSPYKVTILLDKKNNWLENYIISSSLLSKYSRFSILISHDQQNISNQDIVFILSYTKILDSNFLLRNKLNLVVHASDLPKGKGFSPVQWQILEGKNIIPLRLIEAAERVDSGDILLSSSIELNGDELYDEIRTVQASETISIIIRFLDLFPNYFREKQTGIESFYPRRNLSDGELNINDSIRNQFNNLRIANNEEWPSFFIIDGVKYILKIFKDKL